MVQALAEKIETKDGNLSLNYNSGKKSASTFFLLECQK